MSFQPVSERKHQKFLIDLDVTVDDIDQAIERVLELGDRTTGKRQEHPEGTARRTARPGDQRTLHRPLQHVELHRKVTSVGTQVPVAFLTNEHGSDSASSEDGDCHAEIRYGFGPCMSDWPGSGGP
ncbi:VOC family protein [Mycolicibacterium sp. A43C]